MVQNTRILVEHDNPLNKYIVHHYMYTFLESIHYEDSYFAKHGIIIQGEAPL